MASNGDRITITPQFIWRSRESKIEEIEEEIDHGENPNIGNGLKVVNNVLMVNCADDVQAGNRLPLSSNGLSKAFDKVEDILETV